MRLNCFRWPAGPQRQGYLRILRQADLAA